MAISGLELSNENYKEAVSLLSDRFGSKQVVITHHMDTLLQIVPVKTGTDVKQLRAIYDKIEVNVRGLQSLGIKPDQYGCLLVPVIMSKVPEDIRLIILRQFSSEKWTFEVLLKCFKQELEAREKCVAVSKSSRKEEGSKGSDHGSGNGGSSRALNTNSNPSGEGSGIKCTFCKDSHPSAKCDIVKDVDSRWSLVKRKHLCFLCLRSGHGSQSCNSKTICKSCGKKHHISLCKEAVESNGLITNVRASTLLQTAKVKAFNPKTRKHVFVRVVFDMGSNDSYITDKLKKRLSLPTIGWQKLRISGFGGASEGSKSYPMTNLTLRSRFGGDDLPFTAFSVPKIASSINPAFSVSKLGKLACLDLADDFECDSDDEIDLLVGVDQYHRFVTGETKRQIGGPVATHSVFGWLVSGPYGGAEGGVSNSFLLSSISKVTVDEDLARIWEIENFGLEDEGDEERLMVERFKSNIVHDGKRYAVSLPRKETSIPRLELLGALVLSKLILRVRSAMEKLLVVKKIHCWTDSMVVLYWLNSKRDLKQFVRNRVNKIKERVEVSNWRHCPGKENPSDLLTRGTWTRDEGFNGLWLRGPDWLSKGPSDWPVQKIEIERDLLELAMKEEKVTTPTSLVTSSVISADLIDFSRFSRYSRLVRSFAWVRRFCWNLRSSDRRKGSLSSKEVKKAEIEILRLSQSGLSSDRMKELEASLKVELDKDGLVVTVGRLEEACSPARIFMPRGSHLAKLIVLDAHFKTKHFGTAATLAELRSRFWIIKGRQLVKQILRSCFVCSKAQSKPFQSAKEGSLPEFRVSSQVEAFENVGLDYLGPLYVKEKGSDTEEKVWVALFTCATSRAVHLELVHDMTTETFLNAFRRFCGRRGIPSLIISDNAKTFKSASNILTKLSKETEVIDHLSSMKITWKFILEKSPWWGGFWERMVKLTKGALKKTLGKANVGVVGLQTVLVEIEAVINCRPLTYVGSDDVESYLTPSHLVCGKRILDLPNGEVQLGLLDSYHHVRKVMADAKERWIKEYLTELRSYHRQKKTGNSKCPMVGDLVLIKEDKKRRYFWKVGKIEELILGRKGIVRGAIICVGEKKHNLRRPLELLYPLEARGWGSFNLSGNNDTGQSQEEMEKKRQLQISVSVGEDHQSIIPTEVQKLVKTHSLNPDTPSFVPGTSSSVPDTFSSVPDTSSSVPDTSSSVPDTSSSVPDTSSSVPDTSSSVPDTSSSVPGTSSSVPGTSSSVPGTSSSVPDPSSSVPGTSSSVPGTSSSVPDTSSSVPGTSSSIPGTSSICHNKVQTSGRSTKRNEQLAEKETTVHNSATKGKRNAKKNVPRKNYPLRSRR